MHKLETIGTVLTVFGFLAVAVPLTAQASTHHKTRYQGNSCVSSPNPSTAVHEINGVRNPSSTSEMVVYCPMPFSATPGIAHTLYFAGIGGFDRNSTLNIACDVLSTNVTSGNTATLAALQTSGGGPGTGFQTAGFFMPLFPVDSETLYLKCTIPRTQSGWSSYISFYEMDVLTP
jgi:hypothetical protein